MTAMHLSNQRGHNARNGAQGLPRAVLPGMGRIPKALGVGWVGFSKLVWRFLARRFAQHT